MTLHAQLSTKSKLVLGLVLFSFMLALTAFNAQTAHADYNGGHLISNSVFLDAGTMTKQQIQNFLASKGSGLASRSFKLDCYEPGSKERQWYTAVGAPCDTTIPAAHLIYYAAQIYGVSPQVILATLQKEQSLITSPNPTSWQLNQAMGYGCPTTGGCGASNFAYQIDSGTWVKRYHYERANHNMTWWTTSTTWTCGTVKNFYKPNLYPNQNVRFYDEDNKLYRTHFIVNAATSSMYCYTPHAYNNPNGLYGLPKYGTTGRYYSGSYNFVKYFELWFGPTVRERVTTISYDSNTDNTGEMATIGFRLSSKPSGNVIVPVAISSPENARIVGGITEVIITPQTWNEPKFNKVVIAGLHNPSQTGTITYKLDLLRPTSSDARYQHLSPSHFPDVFLSHQMSEGTKSVYRLYDNDSELNVFTASTDERDALVSSGWQNQGTAFSYCPAGDNTVIRLRKDAEKLMVVENSNLHSKALTKGFVFENMGFAVSRQGSVPVYWFFNEATGDNYYKTSSNAMAGYANQGIIFNACEPDIKPVYRLYNRDTRSYFFTESAKERKQASTERGFSNYEGVGFYACADGTDVYRLYRSSTHGYLYTTSSADKDSLVANNNFANQGVQLKLCLDGARDVFTLYNPATGVNFYTAYTEEKDDFVDNVGFRNLGVQFQSK